MYAFCCLIFSLEGQWQRVVSLTVVVVHKEDWLSSALALLEAVVAWILQVQVTVWLEVLLGFGFGNCQVRYSLGLIWLDLRVDFRLRPTCVGCLLNLGRGDTRARLWELLDSLGLIWLDVRVDFRLGPTCVGCLLSLGSSMIVVMHVQSFFFFFF